MWFLLKSFKKFKKRIQATIQASVEQIFAWVSVCTPGSLTKKIKDMKHGVSTRD